MDKAYLSNKRIYSFDIMRIIAICAVILIHITADYVNSYPNDSLEFISNNLLNSLSRFAVPTFFMISGALMLNEEKKLSTKKIIHATCHLFVLLVVWSTCYSVAYYIIKPLVFKEEISVSTMVYALINGHYHMWYLFVLIGLYLITPILRTFIRRDNLPLITVYLNFSIVVCFGIPFVNQIMNLFTARKNLLIDYISNYRVDYFYEYIVYYIVGWYIHNIEIKNRNRTAIYVCGLLGYLTTVICSQMFYDNTKSLNNFFYDNNSLTVFLYSIAVFTFLHNLFERYSFTVSTVVLKMSSLVFGVYLIHPVILSVLKDIFSGIGPAPLDTVVLFFIAALLSFLSVLAISKIPLIKKLIRG